MKTNLRVWAVVLAVMLLVTLLPTTALAADTTYEVSSAAELSTACSAINAAGTGNFVISLKADLENVSMTFNQGNPTVTILGNGHTITFRGEQKINAQGNVTVNLGDKDDSTNILVMTNSSASSVTPGAVALTGNAVVNMYDGVTIRNINGTNYLGAGVIIGATTNQSNAATFHMFGGTITECGINSGSVCFGGGVSVVAGGTFIMDGGTISNCYATTSYRTGNKWLIPSAVGGGVFVYGGTFVMNGGTITGCRAAENGGGVATVSTVGAYYKNGGFGYLDSHVEMNGGTISNCTAGNMGGGIAVLGTYVNANAICATAPSGGYVHEPGVFLNGGTISGNSAVDNGGGVFLLWAQPEIPVELKGMTITGNTAAVGAGVSVLDKWTNAKIENCVITGNHASSLGGGVAVSDNSNAGKTTVTNTLIANNLADEAASDVYVYDSPVVLNAANAVSADYTGQPDDVTGRQIAAWFEDTDASRFVDQAPADRVEYTDYATIPEGIEVMLIAAPEPGEPEPATFTLTKDYVTAEGYDGAGDKTSLVEHLTEDANPAFTIEPVASFNRQVGRDVIPTFSEDSYVIDAVNGEDKVEIHLPDFTTAGVGDYWYKVTETTDGIAGVEIDPTNPRYLHVQVMWKDGVPGSELVYNTELHATGPHDDGTYDDNTGDKATGFTNKFAQGELTVTKKLEGNMTDASKRFKVTVVLTAPEGKTVYSPISYVGGYTAEEGDGLASGTIAADWTGSKTLEVWLRGDDSLVMKNIPDGVTYTVQEADYTGDGYTVAYAADADDTAADDGVTGSISDSTDTVTITNTKNTNLDVGVILRNGPFVLLILAAGGSIVLLLRKKRKNVDEL